MPSPKPVESAPRDASWNRVVDAIGVLPNSWKAVPIARGDLVRLAVRNVPPTGTTKTPATALTVAGRVADRAKGEEGARGGD